MSPRAVAPWTWRRTLRDHGSEQPSVLLTLYTIGTYMDDDGRAYPGQGLIAAGARASVRTVQRHIELAKRTGWLGVELAGRVGQNWRHNVYRAAVPDHLQLTRADLIASDDIIAEWGRIEGDDTIVSPRSTGSDTAMSPPSAGNAPALHVRGDNAGQNVATNHDEGGDIGDAKVATQLCRTNSCSETPALRTPAPEKGRNAQSRVARATRSYTRDELHKRVQAYHEAQMQPDDIMRACLQGASPNDILQALQEECGVPVRRMRQSATSPGPNQAHRQNRQKGRAE